MEEEVHEAYTIKPGQNNHYACFAHDYMWYWRIILNLYKYKN